jgi:hypothetical protein
MAKILLPSMIAGAMLSACVQIAELPQTTSPALLESVRNGTVELTCTTSACSRAWLARVEQAAHLTTQGRWAELSTLLTATNYPSDLGYYFLGCAADGLGSPRAAVHYFETARAEVGNERSCETMGLCRGLNIPEAIDNELAAARRKVASPNRKGR